VFSPADENSTAAKADRSHSDSTTQGLTKNTDSQLKELEKLLEDTIDEERLSELSKLLEEMESKELTEEQREKLTELKKRIAGIQTARQNNTNGLTQVPDVSWVGTPPIQGNSPVLTSVRPPMTTSIESILRTSPRDPGLKRAHPDKLPLPSNSTALQKGKWDKAGSGQQTFTPTRIPSPSQLVSVNLWQEPIPNRSTASSTADTLPRGIPQRVDSVLYPSQSFFNSLSLEQGVTQSQPDFNNRPQRPEENKRLRVPPRLIAPGPPRQAALSPNPSAPPTNSRQNVRVYGGSRGAIYERSTETTPKKSDETELDSSDIWETIPTNQEGRKPIANIAKQDTAIRVFSNPSLSPMGSDAEFKPPADPLLVTPPQTTGQQSTTPTKISTDQQISLLLAYNLPDDILEPNEKRPEQRSPLLDLVKTLKNGKPRDRKPRSSDLNTFRTSMLNWQDSK